MNTIPIQPGLCSIIMPCYNRAAFLAEAIDSIKGQTFAQWELIVVDDGSTDDTRQQIETLTRGLAQPVRYIHQANGGAYAARNTGLGQARGEFIAFYDSDDLWLPHHLTDSIKVLQEHPELDWVYADSKKIDKASGRVVVERGFWEGKRRHPMFKLRAKKHGKLHIFNDPRTVECQLRHNLCCLLQTSVMRRAVFEGRPFIAHYRNEGEDELYPIRAMKVGFKLGFLDDVHLIYRMHGQNASGSAVGITTEQQLRITAAAARGYGDLPGQVILTPAEGKALKWRLANEYFWKRGYAIYWRNGQFDEAFYEFRYGLARNPHNLKMWKTYLLCLLRVWIATRLKRRRAHA